MFSKKMKMAELVDSNFHLLSVLARVGLDGSTGEHTVEEICMQNGLDPDTFLLLCEAYTNPGFQPDEVQLRTCHISDILRYLHQSHDYYLNNALVTLAAAIERLIAPCSDSRKKVIWQFFSDYKSELESHFEIEEKSVIPYIQGLLIGNRPPGFSIDKFEDDHSNIEEKISDLKNLIMKSLPAECDRKQRMNLLNFIYHLRADLERHTCIEDAIMVPMVRLIEDPHGAMSAGIDKSAPDSGKEELSDREKEILVSVAQGLINKEIADKHNISINTVITHRKNISRKTGIKTVAGLTVYAILNNLIDINSVE